MTAPLVQELKLQLNSCLSGWTTLGRLYGLELLAAESISEMEKSARFFARWLDHALRLETFLREYYICKPTAVRWPSNYEPEAVGILCRGIIQREELKRQTDRLKLELSNTILDVLSRLRGVILAKPTVSFLNELASDDLPEPSGGRQYVFQEGSAAIPQRGGAPSKVLNGPWSVATDPIFDKSYSLLEFDAPTFGDSAKQTAPYFWTLANREALASQLCALSAIEYDHLPLHFYWDMAKQAWDEARHANYFLQASVSLIAELQREAGTDSRIPWMSLDQFSLTGRGLPIPREGNLYESMLNADLVERLILMNYRTEAPAVARKDTRINSPFCRIHRDVADAYEIDKLDETSHALIGKRWLEYLVPQEAERAARIEETDLLRNVLLLTSFCHHGSKSMTDLLGRYTSEQQ
jgi:hypothetical protein